MKVAAPYFIYVITQRSTGWVYVGLTKDPAARWKQHLMCAKMGHNHPLYEALADCPDDFAMEVVQEVEGRLEAFEAERLLMYERGSFVPNGFNKRRRDSRNPDSWRQRMLVAVRSTLRTHRGDVLTEETIEDLAGVIATGISSRHRLAA